MKISILTPTIRGEDALRQNKESIDSQTFDPNQFEWITEEGDGKVHDLNAAFNRMLRKAKGELIVFMEDYTRATTNGLIKFWEAYNKEPNTFFTAPLGKTLDWVKINWDWRAYADATDIEYKSWEIDWGAAPREALFKVGGFDEELDKYWSGDNVSVALRASRAGYQFKNLFDNPAVALDHDRLFEHPFRKNFNPRFMNQRLREIEQGKKIDYLN